jgi:VanZ family protein
MITKSKERLWRYGPLIVWLVFIAFASSVEFSAENTSRIIRPLLLWLFPNISEARITFIHFLTRKTAHFTEFAVLGLLSARAFSVSSQYMLRRMWFFAGLLLVVVWALLDEFHQSFVPSRTSSLYDSLIDIAGGLTALIGYAYMRRRLGQRRT